MKVLERNSNHLYEHGSYLQDWRDSQGLIFEHTLLISPLVGKTLIAEAIAGFNVEQYGNWNNQEKYEKYPPFMGTEFWMLPGNKDFVIYHIDGSGRVHALYQADANLWIRRGDIGRIRCFAADHPAYLTPRGQLALEHP